MANNARTTAQFKSALVCLTRTVRTTQNRQKEQDLELREKAQRGGSGPEIIYTSSK